jgi:hypothetical protein
VKAEHLLDLRIEAGGDFESPAGVVQRALILAGFELAEAEKSPSGRRFIFQLDELREGAGAGLILIDIVSERAQEPPAFFPRGLELEGLLIKLDGLRGLVAWRAAVACAASSSKVAAGAVRDTKSRARTFISGVQTHYNTLTRTDRSLRSRSWLGEDRL